MHRGTSAAAGAAELSIRKPVILKFISRTALLRGHTKVVRACAVTADGARMVSGSDDGTLKVWNLTSGVCEKTLSGHMGAVNACAVTADGAHVVSGSDDRTLKVWKLTSGVCDKTLIGHMGAVNACALTLDGEQLVSASGDGTLKLWNLRSGKCELTFSDHTNFVYTCALTLDGERMVSGSDDNMLKVWNLTSGLCEQTFRGRTKAVIVCPSTLDGKRLVSGSWDGTLWVGDVTALQRLGVPKAAAAAAAQGTALTHQRIPTLDEKTDANAEFRRVWQGKYPLPAAAAATAETETPEEFCCPLTLELMNDPVSLPPGHTFERAALMECKSRTNPMLIIHPLTRQEVPISQVIPNRALKAAIDRFKAQHPLDSGTWL